MIDRLLGKPDESLEKHTINVLSVFKKIRERLNDFTHEFWENCEIMCLFHDAGKITDNFQRMINGENDFNIRHEMISGAFIYFFNKEFFSKYNLFTTAIYSHHRKLNNELFSDDQYKQLLLPYERIIEWFDFTKRRLKKNNNKQPNILDENILTKIKKLNASDYRKIFINYFYDRQKINWKDEDRTHYIFIKAILNISDWSASGNFKLAPSFVFDEDYLKCKIQEKLKVNNIQFRIFQKNSKVYSNVLAVAPTGSGKTEASLIWASQKSEHDKIIYCLPTRVTSNNIYTRLKNYFKDKVGKENCALIHSSAIQFYKTLNQDYDTRHYLRDKTFFRNISVCTIDQILTQNFNLGYWEVKTFHCYNAWIIIDEIHLFSPYTLALILNTIKYLRENFNTKFYIMSATMPTKLRDLLMDALGENNFSIVKDNELLNSARNTFEIRECLLQKNIDEIKNSLKFYSKILVVVNTVDQAIELYETLKPFAKDHLCRCFHSRFIQKDRQKKENVILNAEKEDKPILLIATQVVEVSLDIDFDILFTENAPIDALIQRAGRVNRKRKTEKESKVIVHKHSEISSKYVYTEKDILKKTFDVLIEKNGEKIIEKQFLELVDKVYEDIDITNKLSFKNGETAYKEIQRNHFYLGDVKPDYEKVLTRELDSVSVIPWQFYERIYEKEKWEKADYEISIRNFRYKEGYKHTDKDGFKYVDYYYDKEIGLSYANEDESGSNTIIT